MKKNKKSKWILLMACLASLFMLGGCTVRESLEDALTSRDLTAQVTYYSNGGEFEGTPDRKDMYYKDGSKALNIGVVNPSNGTASISRNNYDFAGWYYAVLDSEGNPTFEDSEKKVYKLGEKVDFSKVLQSGDHWQVVAKWSMKVVLNVKLVLEDVNAEIPVEVKEGEEARSYKHGDIVQTRQYSTAGQIVNPKDGTEPFKKKGSGYTFVEYYMDEACTQLVPWPLTKGESQTEDAVIYAKYIEGDWTVIRNYMDVNTMFSSFGQGKKFFVAKDVDASKVTYSPQTNANFVDEIQGNGCTISNLKVANGSLKAGAAVSLFGDIAATAKIENLKLSDLKVEYTFQTSPVEMYFAFTSIASGATIANVQLSGTMKVKGPSNDFTARLYGGYESDDAYLTESQNNGFKVEGTAEDVIEKE